MTEHSSEMVTGSNKMLILVQTQEYVILWGMSVSEYTVCFETCVIGFQNMSYISAAAFMHPAEGHL